MEYRKNNNSLTRGARVHAYAVQGLLRPLRWGYASLLVLELCFTVRADTVSLSTTFSILWYFSLLWLSIIFHSNFFVFLLE